MPGFVNRKSLFVNRIIFASFILFLVTCFWFLAARNLLADSTPLQKAQDDYAFQYSKYVDAANAFQTSIATYNSFKTPTAKEDAFQKAHAKISQADLLYISYLRLANEIGNSFDWQNRISQKSQITNVLNSDIIFFQNNQQTLSSAQTLEQLPQVANDLSNHITNTTIPLVLNTQATYRIVQAQVALDSLKTTASDLKNYGMQKLQGTDNTSFFANWNSEVEKIGINAQAQIDLAIKSTNSQTLKSQGDLDNITRSTQSAQNILNSAIPVFNEVANLK